MKHEARRDALDAAFPSSLLNSVRKVPTEHRSPLFGRAAANAFGHTKTPSFRLQSTVVGHPGQSLARGPASNPAQRVAGSGSRQRWQPLHRQHSRHGAANSRSGEASRSRKPNPAKMPTTCVLCQTTDAREWPSLFLQGPLS